VIRAPIPASIAGRGPRVRRSHDARVGGQAGVHVVGVDGDLAAGRVAGHVLVDHGEHVLVGRLVVGEHGLRAEEAALLAAVEVELESVLGRVPRVGEHAEGLEDDDHAGAVVVGARAAGGGRAAGGVIVGRDDHQAGVAPRDLGDDGRLVEGVGEAGDGDGRVGGGDRGDGVEEPGPGLRAVGAPVVAVVEAGGGC